MGKTKTSFVPGTDDSQSAKPSYDKAAKEAKRKARGIVAVDTDTAPLPEVTDVVSEATGENAESESKQVKLRSKNYKAQIGKVDKNREYKLSDAVSLVKETSYSKFDGSVELHVVIRKEGFTTNVSLPHSSGKTKRIEVADEGTVEKLKAGKVDFDVLLATADMMPKLVAFARILGPKGLMPNPKNGTLIKSKKDADAFSASTTTLKTEKKAPVIHTVIGKVSQKTEELVENAEAVFSAISKKQVVKVYLTSSMGPSVRVSVS